MPGFPSPFGGQEDDELFDGYDEFVPDHIPEPDVFLAGHDVLAGPDHLTFHRLTRELFEERKVYDMTFNYNLARLNLDTRHEDAGYRYAIEKEIAEDAIEGESAEDAIEDESVDHVLRAEFTPTTPFCPQAHTLTIASFRAWNGLSDRHEYDLVRVRVAPTHHQSDTINERLADLEREYLETGDVSPDSDEGPADGPKPMEGSVTEGGGVDGSSDAPF